VGGRGAPGGRAVRASRGVSYFGLVDAFWTLARRMLRYKPQLAGGLACACVSAGGLGVGIAALKPILDTLRQTDPSRHKGLPELAADWNHAVPGFLSIPPEVASALPPGPFTAVVSIILALGVLTLVGSTAQFLHVYLALSVVNRAVTNIRREAFHRAVRLPLRDVVRDGPTQIISRIVNDAAALSSGFSALMSRAVVQASRGLVGLVVAVIFEWRITVAAIIVGPLLYLVINRLGRRIRRSSRRALEQQAGLLGAAAEALQGLRVVKIHTTERYEAGRFHRINKQVLRHLMRARTARALASPVVEAAALFICGALAILAIKLILDGHLDASSFMIAMGSLAHAAGALKPLTGLVNDVQQSEPAAARLLELMRLEPEPGHDATLPRLPRHARDIEFDAVRFAYPGAHSPALDGVSVRVRHGERLAIVGPNGSGKTTLLSLVPRLFDPDEGCVRIDGVDVRGVGVRSLRRQIGVVTQETVLFRGTIRANIAYGAEGATPAMIEHAARQARAHEFITALPLGYDSPLGEQGRTLSGGQRQRIAIARAILRDPAILILDEATSMIDADSERKIADAIADFSRGRTCLVVAHRLSTVKSADRIVVMDAGRIVDQGGHDDLMERCATYRLIAQGQLFAPPTG
jgi:subfamily B ATP-binding cassette protein MsbA